MIAMETTATACLARRELAAAVQRLTATARKHSPREVLTTARLTISGDELELTATDLERVHTERLNFAEPASRQFSAVALVNVAELKAATQATKDKAVFLTVDDGRVKFGGVKLSAAPSVDEFPAASHCLDGLAPFGGSLDVIGSAVIPAAELRRMLQLAEFATDSESSRYALGGCLFELGSGAEFARVIGCDGRRLSCLQFGAEPSSVHTGIVPAETCRLAIKQLKAAELVAVELLKSEPEAEPEANSDANPEAAETRPPVADMVRIASFDANRELLSMTTTRTVEGRFPNWQQVLPYSAERLGLVDVDTLDNAVRRVALTTSDESRGVDFAFRLGRLFVFNRGIGGTRAIVPVEVKQPPAEYERKRETLDVRFVAQLTKAAKAAGVKTLSVWSEPGNAKPIVFGFGADRLNCQVIMPMAR